MTPWKARTILGGLVIVCLVAFVLALARPPVSFDADDIPPKMCGDYVCPPPGYSTTTAPSKGKAP